MKKRTGIVLACLLVVAVALSVKAHAVESPQAVIDTKGENTSVSITDITPREDEKNDKSEAKHYTVGSHYPVSVQTTEDHGIQMLVKTFLVPADTDPQALIEENLTRRGVVYEVSDILCQKLPEEVEKKTVSQTVTLDSESEKTEDILPLLKTTMDYREDGFSGTLALDRSSIQTKAAGTSGYAYQLKETREFTGLDRNDPYYIPKTAEKNGVTLSLSDVKWTPMASSADNSEVPSLFSATALYTGTAWGQKTDGYIVTADYTGEVSRATQGDMVYSIIYEAIQPESGASPWGTVGLVVLTVALVSAAGFGIFWVIATRPRKKPRSASTDKKDQLKETDKSMEAAL